MTNLKETIAQINARELGSLSAAATRDNALFDWEDEALMSLLVDGPAPIHEAWNADDKIAEKTFVSAANELSNLVKCHAAPETIKSKAAKLVNEQAKEYTYRLRAHARNCIDELYTRKGLLIVGEGGIGKTRFLYDLANELAKQNKNFAASFSDQSASELLEINLHEIANQFDDGFTYIFDAINERDEKLARQLINQLPDILAQDKVSVIVSTRSGSPFSQECELESVLFRKYVFPGVDISNLIPELSTYGDQLFFRFQDMFIGGNPRNILAAKAAIEDLSHREELQQAHIQRTTLIERCMKKQLAGERSGSKRWAQTKKLCSFLYSKQANLFDENDVQVVLADETAGYLTDMLSTGFIRAFRLGSKEHFAFSSESQMNILIARSVHSDLKRIQIDTENFRDSAERVAEVVKTKSFGANTHEMCQIAIDRFISFGPMLFVELLHAFRNADLFFDELRILRETIFPQDADFSTIRNRIAIDPASAFIEFGGYVINPLNITNYSNDAFVKKPEIVIDCFKENWRSYELSDLIHRVRNIASYASYANSLTQTAILEWTWLSVWASSSTNSKLRVWAIRLLQVLCDRSEQAIEIAVTAFPLVKNTFSQRAIARVLSHSRKKTQQRADVVELARSVTDDYSVADYLVVHDMCIVLGIPITESHTRNFYNEFGNLPVTETKAEVIKNLVLKFDPFFDHYLPFEYLPFFEGIVQMSALHDYLAVDKNLVKNWNDRFKANLSCPNPAPCTDETVSWSDADSVVHIPFEKEKLDPARLYNMFVKLLFDACEMAGYPVSDLIETADYYRLESGDRLNPRFRPVLDAAGLFMGSLASNYYLSEIQIASCHGARTGFACDDSWTPGDEGVRVDTSLPLFNNIIDIARRKIQKRVQSPCGKPRSWFDDDQDTQKSLLEVLRPITICGVEWIPLAADIRIRMRREKTLDCSNEMLIHVASIDAPHLNGIGDRKLTIELDELEGNIEDYCEHDSLLCVDVHAPEYAGKDTFSFAMCLPPQRLIAHFDLVFNRYTGIYHYPDDDEPIVICDGNPRSYMADPVSKLILMRGQEYRSLVEQGLIKYYAFTERFEPHVGYRNNCNRYWEFLPNGTLIGTHLNDGSSLHVRNKQEACRGCYFSNAERENRGMPRT